VDVDYLFAMLPVTDLGVAVEWYHRLLGRPPDMRPNDAEATWRLTDSASICLLEDVVHAGGGGVTVIVGNLDATLAGCADRGIPAVEPFEVGQAGRKAVLPDPDGNVVSVVELSGPA